MPRNQEKKATRYFNRRNQNRLFFLKEIEQAIRKKKNSTSEKDENSKENEKGTKWTDVAGLIVNAILAVFTGLLFWIALDQKQDVRKSSQAAIDAVNESRKANITSDSNYQLSKQSFESGNVDAQKRFKFDSNIIKQQIDYLKLTHNDFLLENRPVLQVIKIGIDTPKLGKRIVMRYSIANFGKQPAKITISKIKLTAHSDSTYNDFSNLTASGTNAYLNMNSSVEKWIASDKYIWGQDDINAFNKGDFYLFLIGEFYYKNSITNAQRVYRFNYRFSRHADIQDVEMIVDDDDYIIKK